MFGSAGVFAEVQLRKAIHDVYFRFSETAMTFIMMLVGLGMVLGMLTKVARISGTLFTTALQQ